MKDFDEFNVKFLSVVSYIGPLYLIGKFSVEKDSEQVKFHNKQGEILFYVFCVLYFICALLHLVEKLTSGVIELVAFLMTVGVSVALIILMLIGVTSAFKGTKVRLPIVSLFVGNSK